MVFLFTVNLKSAICKNLLFSFSDSHMESTMEASQVTDMPKPKPALGPKPRLAPKPFSLQKNTTIRSIHAPKTVTTTPKTTQQSGKSEAAAVPRPTLPTPARQHITSKPNPSSVSALTGDQAKTTTKIALGPCGEDTPDSTVVKSAPAQQTAPAPETPKSAPLQKDDIIQTNLKAPSDVVTKPEETDGNKEDDKTLSSVIQKLEEPKSDVSSAANPTYGRGSTRKRLSMELTSKFESGGLSLPPQPHSVVTISTTSAKDDVNKPESSNPERSQTTSEPSNGSDDGGAKEDYSGGGSIKRRISLLFDSSSRPEVPIKREEPEILNGTGGVKARIKNWASETSSEGPKTEKKSQFVPRPPSMRCVSLLKSVVCVWWSLRKGQAGYWVTHFTLSSTGYMINVTPLCFISVLLSTFVGAYVYTHLTLRKSFLTIFSLTESCERSYVMKQLTLRLETLGNS